MLRIRIAFSGAHSTGKSSVIEALNQQIKHISGYEPTVVNKVARSVLRRGLPVNRDSTLETYLAIFETHIKLDIKADSGLVLLDRFLPDYVGYGIVHGNCPRDLMNIAKHCHELLRKTIGYDQVYFLPVEFDLVADGYRDADPKYQKDVSKAIQTVLNEWQQPFELLSGTIQCRATQVLDLLKTLPGGLYGNFT